MMIRPFLYRLLRDEAGSSVVELGLVMPVFLMTALGGADFVMGFGKKLEVQQFAQSGADFVLASGESIPSDSEVAAEVAAASGLPTSAVTVSKFTECNAVKATTYGQCSGTSAVQANYMAITVTDTYTPVLNIPGIAAFAQTTALKGKVTVRIP